MAELYYGEVLKMRPIHVRLILILMLSRTSTGNGMFTCTVDGRRAAETPLGLLLTFRIVARHVNCPGHPKSL